jgi:hypothetical protein
MIDEDLRTARRRARRWGELREHRAAIADRVRKTRRAIDAVGAWDQETVAAEEARLGAFANALTVVERELAEVGPARELYEELLAREEQRLAESADPRGSELLEIGRLLAELDVELPARSRARAAGLAVLRGRGDREAMAEFVRQVRALGMTVEPGPLGCAQQVDEPQAPDAGTGAGDVQGLGARSDVGGHQGLTAFRGFGDVQGLVGRLDERCRQLERLRDELRARREDLLLAEPGRPR